MPKETSITREDGNNVVRVALSAHRVNRGLADSGFIMNRSQM